MPKRITIIGGGPGGYTAAFEAAVKGAEVTLIEAKFLGGTCLNSGCIPTKALKASAEVFESIHTASQFGVTVNGAVSLDMSAVIDRKDKVSAILRGGLEKTCAQLKVKTIFGSAKILSAQKVEVTVGDAIQEIESDAIIIATGSLPLELPALPVDHTRILSSDDALELRYVPNNILIVGGGVVGCELAFIYQAFGAKVTIVEGLERVLPIPSLDEEISKLTQREMKKAGIKVELGKIVDASEVCDNCVKAHIVDSPFLTHAKESEPKTIETDVIIVTAGRAANSAGLCLESVGIKTDARGYVLVNEYLETNLENVYAIGDILGPSKIMLAHMAVMEGLVAVENILGVKKACDYSVCPSAIFVRPEIGSVGITEKQAQEQNKKVCVEVFQMRELGKAQAMNSIAGVLKLIADEKSGKVLGAHLAGEHASDIIAELTLAIKMGATVTDLANTIHAHPTLSEAVFETAHRMV